MFGEEATVGISSPGTPLLNEMHLLEILLLVNQFDDNILASFFRVLVRKIFYLFISCLFNGS